MDVFFNALQGMVSLTLLCLVGYGVARKGWVAPETEIFIPRLVTAVVLPPFLMENVVAHFQREELLRLIQGSLVPFASIVFSFALFRCLAWALRVQAGRRGLFAVAACTSNTIFVGIPVTTALLGGSAVTWTLLYFFGNTVFFWTIGNYCIAREGAHGRLPSLGVTVRRVFSPPLCGMLTGVAIVLLGLPLPRPVSEACRYLGDLATPLALLYIGMTLLHVDWHWRHIGKDMVLALILRLGVSPCILLACRWLAPLQAQQEQVYVIMAGLPTMTSIALVSAYYGADREFGGAFVALSTLGAMLTVPVWMTLFTHGL